MERLIISFVPPVSVLSRDSLFENVPLSSVSVFRVSVVVPVFPCVRSVIIFPSVIVSVVEGVPLVTV